MTDDLVGRLRVWLDELEATGCLELFDGHIPTLSEAAARIEALEAENRAVRIMLADLHAATLTIATPRGSQLDEARDAAAAHFQNRNHPHAD